MVTLKQYRLRGIVRALSAVGDVAAGLGLYVDLSVEALHRAARRETGLDDFGDSYYLEALHQLLRALEEARAGGASLVFLLADLNDWPRRLYERLGFDEIGRTWSFTKWPDGESPA